jgi:hypothetical protein
MPKLDLILIIVAPALELALLAIFVARKLIRRYLFFIAYLVCLATGAILLLCIRGNSTEYYLVYWIGQGIYGLFTLLVITEIFKSALRMVYSELGRLGLALLLGLFLLVTFLFWRTVHHLIAPSFLGHIAMVAYSFELGVAFIASAIFLMALWQRLQHGTWGQYNFGILAGYGLIGVGKLVAYFAILGLGNQLNVVFRYMRPFTFIAATIVWLVTFLGKEEPVKKEPNLETLRKLLQLLSQRIELTRRIAKRFRLWFRYSHT